MKKMRNSYNSVNESGNLIKDSKEVNIMHMNAKPLVFSFMVWGLIMFMLFIFLATAAGVSLYSLNNKIEDLRIEFVKQKVIRQNAVD